MKTLALAIILPLMLALAACGQGYTPENGPMGDSGIHTYSGGPTMPSVTDERSSR